MDARTRTKMVNALMSRFVKLYEEVHGERPVFNRNTEKWGFGYMLDDLEAQSMATLEYYFTLRRPHSSRNLLDNYHQIKLWMVEDAEDAERRRELRANTKKKVEEHEKQWHQRP